MYETKIDRNPSIKDLFFDITYIEDLKEVLYEMLDSCIVIPNILLIQMELVILIIL